jgi:hypothetical protein
MKSSLLTKGTEKLGDVIGLPLFWEADKENMITRYCSCKNEDTYTSNINVVLSAAQQRRTNMITYLRSSPTRFM